MTRTRAKLEQGLFALSLSGAALRRLTLAFGLTVPGCAISAIAPYESDEAGVGKPHEEDAGEVPERDSGGDSPDRDASTTDLDAGADAGDPAGPEPEDAGSSKPDAGTPGTDAGSDAGIDASTPDAGSDAGVPDRAPKIDGIIEAGEWATATRVTQSEPTNWGVGRNQVSDLYAKIHDGRLYIALNGMIEPQNAMVLYVDTVAQGGSAPTDLKDDTGALDNAISAALTVPSNVKVDFAFGVRAMGKWGNGLDDTMGWRDLRDPSNFAWIDTTAVAPAVCSLQACETSISLDTLAPSANTMLMFARIVTATGDAASNQTLPYDAPNNPLTVSNVLTLKIGD